MCKAKTISHCKLPNDFLKFYIVIVNEFTTAQCTQLLPYQDNNKFENSKIYFIV